MAEKVSIVIPSLNCKYLTKTVDDIYKNATGNFEVIVALDGWWPNPILPDRENLIIIHHGDRKGMREAINHGVSIAKGRYILKCDDHCSFGKGFDQILQGDMQDNWLVVPSRVSLDPVTWETRRDPVSYEYLAYPYSSKRGIGLYSKKWWGEDGFGKNSGKQEFYWKENHRKDILIDDIMIFQGSCWFMAKSWFNKIGGLFDNKCMYQEPCELTLKTWLSGGRCVVNKKTWYAHMHKAEEGSPGSDTHGRGYKLDLREMRETEKYGTWFWMNDQWPQAKHKIKWLIEKFWPIPGWPDDWEEQRDKFYEKHLIKGES